MEHQCAIMEDHHVINGTWQFEAGTFCLKRWKRVNFNFSQFWPENHGFKISKCHGKVLKLPTRLRHDRRSHSKTRTLRFRLANFCWLQVTVINSRCPHLPMSSMSCWRTNKTSPGGTWWSTCGFEEALQEDLRRRGGVVVDLFVLRSVDGWRCSRLTLNFGVSLDHAFS